MKKSTLFLIIFVAIFFTSTLVLIYLNYLKPQSISTALISTTTNKSISPATDPTANWKTCINSTKNFSINFPQELNFDEKSCNYSLVDYNNVENIEVVDSTTDFQKNWLFSIDVIDSDLSPSDFINNKVCEVPDICSDPIQGILPSSLEINISSHYPETDTIFKSNGKIFTFSLNARNPDTKPATGVRDLYHQVLSTFKFIDPTADWKTYENKEYGFSFKFPQDYFKYVNDQAGKSIYFAPTEGEGAEMGTPMATLGSGDVWFTVDISLAKSGQKSTSKEFRSLDGPQPVSEFQSVIVENGNAIKIVLSSFSNDTLNKFESTFNQILSTFKFTDTSSQKTPAVIPKGWKSGYYKSEYGNQQPFTIAYPSNWFFEGMVFRNFDYNNLNPSSNLRPEYVKCDVYDSSSGSSGLFNIEDFATDIIEIARESDNSYKIIRGNEKLDIGESVATTYQLSTNGNILANVTCYAFSISEAKIVDQIVKTIRY